MHNVFPIGYEKESHDFPWGYKELDAGRKIRRKVWDKDYYIRYSEKFGITGHKGTNRYMKHNLHMDDFKATDWESVEE